MSIKVQILLPFALLCVAGCNVGSAPAGMSNDDAKAAIEAMSPEDKIRAIASSPMPGPEKEAQYKRIEEETGVKASEVLGGSSGSAGVGTGSGG